jgi:nitrogenase-stabilizing/protective protein
MNELTLRLMRLSTAEHFLDFFGVRYEQSVVDVARLHILKRFHQYLRGEQDLESLDDAALYGRYRGLLLRAYQDFVESTPAREKVFKVFGDAQVRAVPLAAVRAALPSAGAR